MASTYSTSNLKDIIELLEYHIQMRDLPADVADDAFYNGFYTGMEAATKILRDILHIPKQDAIGTTGTNEVVTVLNHVK